MKHITLFSLSAVILISTLAGAARAADISSAPHSLTREEVRADFDAWKRAGLAEKWSGDGNPDVFSKDYQRRLAIYESLRVAAR